MSDPALDLDAVVATVRGHAGLTGKQPIAGVRHFVDASDPIHGPGDDGAVVEIASSHVVVCGEAISPPFVAADPYGAGFAAVLANVNDVAAMGGVPRAIVSTLVGPAEVTSEVMRGMREASVVYDVPLVGGHLTQRPGDTSLSAFAVGEAECVLSMANVEAGQAVLFACSLDGEMRADFPFFTSIERQGPRLARDVRLLARVRGRRAGRRGEGCVDGRTARLAGHAPGVHAVRRGGGLGAPPLPGRHRPAALAGGLPHLRVLVAGRAGCGRGLPAVFEAHELACEVVGTVDGTGQLVVKQGTERRTLLDLRREPVTGLWADW